jgi:hypothetical protein
MLAVYYEDAGIRTSRIPFTIQYRDPRHVRPALFGPFFLAALGRTS